MSQLSNLDLFTCHKQRPCKRIVRRKVLILCTVYCAWLYCFCVCCLNCVQSLNPVPLFRYLVFISINLGNIHKCLERDCLRQMKPDLRQLFFAKGQDLNPADVHPLLVLMNQDGEKGDCKFWLSDRGRRRGDRCKFKHTTLNPKGPEPHQEGVPACEKGGQFRKSYKGGAEGKQSGSKEGSNNGTMLKETQEGKGQKSLWESRMVLGMVHHTSWGHWWARQRH